MYVLSDGSDPSQRNFKRGFERWQVRTGFRKLCNLCKGLGRRASGGFPGEPFLAVELRLAPVVGLMIRVSVPRSRLPSVPGGSKESYRFVDNIEQKTAREAVRMRRHGEVAEGFVIRFGLTTSSGSARPLVCRKRPRVQGRRRVEYPSSSFFLRRLRQDDLVPRSGRWVWTSRWRIFGKNKAPLTCDVCKCDRSNLPSLDPWTSYTSDCCRLRPPRDCPQPFCRGRYALKSHHRRSRFCGTS